MHCSVISLLCKSLIFHHPSFPWSSSNHLFLKRSSHQSLLCRPSMFFHSFAIQPNILQLKSPIFFHNVCHTIPSIILTSRWPHFFLYSLPKFHSLLSLHFIKHVSCTLLTFTPSLIRCQVVFQTGHGFTLGSREINWCPGYVIYSVPSFAHLRINWQGTKSQNLTYPIHSYVRCFDRISISRKRYSSFTGLGQNVWIIDKRHPSGVFLLITIQELRHVETSRIISHSDNTYTDWK